MSDWLDDLLLLGSARCSVHSASDEKPPQTCVLITVVSTRGSCPREAGTRMIVTLDANRGTIGGGHLEFNAIGIARELLDDDKPAFRLERFPLGARLGQCCGGVVNLSFEFIPAITPLWVTALKEVWDTGQEAVMVSPMDGSTNKLIVTKQACAGSLPDVHQQELAANRALKLLGNAKQAETVREDELLYEPIDSAHLQIAIFGAGHVGKALVNVLGTLPCRVVWIDSRISEFPAQAPANVQMELSDQPESEVDELPRGALVVIMTHSHALDQAICNRVLRRNDIPWCGLIGSLSKRRNFEKRLLAQGLGENELSRLACPIGVDGITGKHPAQIAISVAAQLLLLIDAQQSAVVAGHQAA